MLMLAEDEDGQRMNDRQLHDEIMTIFIAGHETTALTLTWAFTLLARAPDVERKLHSELDTVLNGRLPSLADLPDLPYTEMVIKETLRLYPIAWLILRQATADLRVGPYRIPKGHQIWISPYTMHRHPHYFSAPEKFEPERFGPGADLASPVFGFPCDTGLGLAGPLSSQPLGGLPRLQAKLRL